MVPDGWEYKKLGNVAELQRGFDLPSSKRIEGNVPILSSSGITGYHIEAKVKAPGIVTGRYGSIGEVFYVTEDFWPLNTSLWVKDFHNNHPLYLFYLLCSFDFKKFSDKTGVPGVNRNDLHAVKVKVPSLPEQKKIAQILSTWDKAITTTEKLLANSEQQKKALMQQLLTGKKRFPTDVSSWRDYALSEIFEFKKGKGLSKGVIACTGKKKCILYGELYTKYNEVIKAVFSRTHSNDGFPSKYGDVLVPCSTTTSGIDLAKATALFENDVLLGGDINVLRPKISVDSAFISYLLTHVKKNEIASRAQGITIIHLYGSDLKSLNVTIPASLSDQQKIASVFSTADQEIEKLKQKLDCLKQEKKALMQQLLTGKRRVKVAEISDD
ncbi:TPA: restriction endonuclease subunit S [Legionella pneumophila]